MSLFIDFPPMQKLLSYCCRIVAVAHFIEIGRIRNDYCLLMAQAGSLSGFFHLARISPKSRRLPIVVGAGCAFYLLLTFDQVRRFLLQRV
jgi:hypothetical protein